MLLFDRTTDPQAKLDNLEFRLGEYDILFDISLIPAALQPIPDKVNGKQFDVNGKRVRLVSLKYVYGEKKFLGYTYQAGNLYAVARVKIEENPLPALAVILGAAALLAFAAGYMVLQVRQLSVENPVLATGLGLGSIVLFAGIGFVGYKAIKGSFAT